MTRDLPNLIAPPNLARLNLDRPVVDTLLLGTVGGAVDYLVEDLRGLPPGTVTMRKRYRDGVLIDYAGPLAQLAQVRYFDTCAVALFPDRTERLRESLTQGVLAGVAAPGNPVMFRVGNLGDDRWDIRDDLERGLGWENSANDWSVNIETSPDGLVGEIGGLYLTPRFGGLHRAPASTNPVVGAVIVRLAKITLGDTVLDPFCGAGTLLVLAGEMAAPGQLIGGEVNRHWARATRDNLAVRGQRGSVLNADARHLPVATESVDRIVANLPFGKRVGSHRVNIQLYPAALREISRVMRRNGRAALLTEDKRLFRETVQRTPHLRVIKEIVLERGGVHPSIYVIVKRGNTRTFDAPARPGSRQLGRSSV